VAAIRENTSASDNASIRAQKEAPPRLDGTSSPPLPSNDSGSLYTAVHEQLGLKLDAQRGLIDVLVIDSVERSILD
jgi:uncharacterized protein (TIGR03435 family)